MDAAFPFVIPDPLPHRISPCPILEAILEIRFVTQESWNVLPGLLYSLIRGKYPDKRDLPLSHLPDEFRRREPSFTHQPLVQFHSPDFIIQFGPRVVSLVTKPDAYPGWQQTRAELVWLLDILKSAAFITEGERLGVRYIDFFPRNIFPDLTIGAHVCGTPLDAPELTLTTAFHRPPLSGRLVLTNGALVQRGETSASGSVMDIDVWASSLDFDLFTDGLARIDDLHTLLKGVFFSLLKPEFLAKLKPTFHEPNPLPLTLTASALDHQTGTNSGG